MDTNKVHNEVIHELPGFISKEEATNLIEFLTKNDSGDENWGSPCFPWYWDVIRSNYDQHELSLTEGVTEQTIPDLRDRILLEAEKIFGKEVKFVNLKGQHHPAGAKTPPSAYFDVAVWLFLNDDFEGGEFILPSLDIKIPVKQGSLLIFNEGEDAKHGVEVVTRGHRYSLQGTFRFKDSHPSTFRWHNNKQEEADSGL